MNIINNIFNLHNSLVNNDSNFYIPTKVYAKSSYQVANFGQL